MRDLFEDAARTALEARWLELTRGALPSVASERGWPIRFDHCFQRVLLDAACGGVWYEHISARPAYRAASDAQLERAVALGDAVLDGAANLPALNQQSLIWRGKL